MSHVIVTPKTDFIITGSVDGHIKFWKKTPGGIEFVKHFRVHLGNIQGIACNSNGTLLCTISNDKSLKVRLAMSGDVVCVSVIVPSEWRFAPQSLDVCQCDDISYALLSVHH